MSLECSISKSSSARTKRRRARILSSKCLRDTGASPAACMNPVVIKESQHGTENENNILLSTIARRALSSPRTPNIRTIPQARLLSSRDIRAHIDSVISKSVSTCSICRQKRIERAVAQLIIYRPMLLAGQEALAEEMEMGKQRNLSLEQQVSRLKQQFEELVEAVAKERGLQEEEIERLWESELDLGRTIGRMRRDAGTTTMQKKSSAKKRT